jgi:kynurenine formamidase
MAEVSNWGRWGAEDERGTANLLEGEVVLRACRTPSSGRVYNLGIPIRQSAPVAAGRAAPLHLMAVDGADFAALGRNDEGSADDYLFLATHGTTHVDALSHLWYGGQLYNGFPFTSVRSSGASRCGIEKVGGLVCRAHLLDFAARRTAVAGLIRSGDVAACIADHGIVVQPGDGLLIRTGWMDAALQGEVADREFPVVDPDLAEWIAEHDIALIAADNEAIERTALATESPPLHRVLIRDLGVYLLEMLDLSGPAADGVTSGMFVAAPLAISRGVGSPLNPLLIV